MDLPAKSSMNIPLFSMLRERMTWLHQRQDVLSQNVANADTPGYVARDLKALDFESALNGASTGSQMRTTNSRHIAMTPSHMDKFDDQETPDQASNPNGNSVSLEMEMIKVADTQAQFQAAANIYAKAMTLMKTAIGH
jgi:flagellar basal-body rod protein FlgB